MLKTLLAAVAATAALGLAAPSEAQAGDWSVEFRFGSRGSGARFSYGRFYDCAPRYDYYRPVYRYARDYWPRTYEYRRPVYRYGGYGFRTSYRYCAPRYVYCR